MYSTSLLLFLIVADGAHGLYSFQVKRYRVSIKSHKGVMSVCIPRLSSSSSLLAATAGAHGLYRF